MPVTKNRPLRKPTLETLLTKYTDLWGHSPLLSPHERAYANIRAELWAQRDLQGTFANTAAMFEQLANKAQGVFVQSIYKEALAEVQRAMQLCTPCHNGVEGR